MRRVGRAAILFLLFGVLIAACGGGGASQRESTTTPTVDIYDNPYANSTTVTGPTPTPGINTTVCPFDAAGVAAITGLTLDEPVVVAVDGSDGVTCNYYKPGVQSLGVIVAATVDADAIAGWREYTQLLPQDRAALNLLLGVIPEANESHAWANATYAGAGGFRSPLWCEANVAVDQFASPLEGRDAAVKLATACLASTP